MGLDVGYQHVAGVFSVVAYIGFGGFQYRDQGVSAIIKRSVFEQGGDKEGDKLRRGFVKGNLLDEGRV
jgi:hypothetical protein